jgi:hypothetical protein
MKYVLLLALFMSACAAPTLQQRQANWRRYQDMTRATCAVGEVDPAMPTDVRVWCAEVTEP